MEKTQVLLGIDPGSKSSGIIIFQDDTLLRGDNILNEELFELIDKYTWLEGGYNLFVVYEDIRPYTSRFNMETIDTCKIIGRLEYVLAQQRVPFKAVTRNEVKSFVFNRHNSVCVPEIIKKIEKKGRLSKEGKALKPSFQYVDDRIVKQAMKAHWNLKTPKPGQRDHQGIRLHAWQALGAVTCYFNIEDMLMKGRNL